MQASKVIKFCRNPIFCRIFPSPIPILLLGEPLIATKKKKNIFHKTTKLQKKDNTILHIIHIDSFSPSQSTLSWFHSFTKQFTFHNENLKYPNNLTYYIFTETSLICSTAILHSPQFPTYHPTSSTLDN